jgi:uncharacterized protein YjbJ (UPF0337 family)
MNRDQWEGKWKQLQGHIKKEWGKLTDDDLDRARGDMDILIGKIQEKYGLAREAIERRLEAMMNPEHASPQR